jgi:hypothetical protein
MTIRHGTAFVLAKNFATFDTRSILHVTMIKVTTMRSVQGAAIFNTFLAVSATIRGDFAFCRSLLVASIHARVVEDHAMLGGGTLLGTHDVARLHADVAMCVAVGRRVALRRIENGAIRNAVSVMDMALAGMATIRGRHTGAKGVSRGTAVLLATRAMCFAIRVS